MYHYKTVSNIRQVENGIIFLEQLSNTRRQGLPFHLLSQLVWILFYPRDRCLHITKPCCTVCSCQDWLQCAR